MFGRPTSVALKGAPGRLLVTATTDEGVAVGVTATHLVHAAPGEAVVAHPWHEVVAGGWDRGRQRLRVRLVDGTVLLWQFTEDVPRLAQSFRERVGASVVLTQDVPVAGGTVKVAVRKNLATREMVQMILAEGDGVDLTAPATVRAVEEAQAELREQVGLDGG